MIILCVKSSDFLQCCLCGWMIFHKHSFIAWNSRYLLFACIWNYL
uniref:Uncharacterized protein n=1 Tax=Rhizophora mucronata TaxID=61149 RepID=A0A2P2IT97_RHIMU